MPRGRGQIMNDASLFGDRSALEKDLFLLECVRLMRVEFSERVCARSKSQAETTLATLRLEATYQMAEFYYLLRALDIKTAEQIENLTNIHNDDIIKLTKDTARMARMGLSNDRLLNAIFTSDTLPRLVESLREQPGAIDQSNLARFLAESMSTETCRKVVVASQSAGFLARERTHYGTVMISSLGVLEEIFGQCVRDARKRLAK